MHCSRSGFVVRAPFEIGAGQREAVEALAAAVGGGSASTVLRGVTGSGKSATMAWLVERLGRPTLVLAPNKALAAQLAGEFRLLLPDNKVELFISYYDHYQPEAYVAASDTFIEKEATINAEIDRLRHSATEALATRRDTVVVASVSAIYSLGPPGSYAQSAIEVGVGDEVDVRELCGRLVASGYDRSSVLARGRFNVAGDTIEIWPAGSERLVRVELFGDEVERIRELDVLTREGQELESAVVLPATHWSTPADRLAGGIDRLRAELSDRVVEFTTGGRVLEAQRLAQRTEADLELLAETGTVRGIENYSAQLEGRERGEPPWTLLDYFGDDLLVIVDESHVTAGQISAAAAGDRARKEHLVEHGFRLPSAADNRPLTMDEFLARVPQVVWVSATPGVFELERSDEVVELLVRPTGLLEPTVEVCPADGQVADLVERCQAVVAAGWRVLVTALTKRNAEDLAGYLTGEGLRTRYMTGDTETLERVALMRDLRLGEYDVLVGVNLLREGLDVPEVALVAVLDADKEGFLRSTTSLIQTMGRAARNRDGHVVLYANETTASMRAAMDEVARRRAVQVAHNEATGTVPMGVVKEVGDLLTDMGLAGGGPGGGGRGRGASTGDRGEATAREVVELEAEMLAAAEELRFEDAARLRDRIRSLRGS